MAAAAPHFAGWIGNLASVCAMCEGPSRSSSFPRQERRRLCVLLPSRGRWLSVPSRCLGFKVARTLVHPLRLDEAPLHPRKEILHAALQCTTWTSGPACSRGTQATSADWRKRLTEKRAAKFSSPPPRDHIRYVIIRMISLPLPLHPPPPCNCSAPSHPFYPLSPSRAFTGKLGKDPCLQQIWGVCAQMQYRKICLQSPLCRLPP